MKYSELFAFDPVEDAVALCDADQESAARRLVGSFVLSDALAARLTGQVFPLLSGGEKAVGRLLFIVGPQGVGKSHLLAILSALAERSALVDAVPRRSALAVTEAAQAAGAAGVDAIAGRFCVIRLELPPAGKSLRGLLLGQLEAKLAEWGVPYRFPREARSPRAKLALDDVMAALREKFPEQGLMLVADELLGYLKSRNARDLVLDLEFLRELDEASRDLKFRFVAGLQESLFENASFAAAEDALHRLRRRCTELVLDRQDMRSVVAGRIARKTAAQRALVREHLLRFAPSYSTMRSRLDEFVDMFPVHPDYVRIFETNVFAERRGVFRMLSDVIARRLDEEVPANEPGLITYDAYWELIRRNPAGRAVPEIAAVIDFSRTLELRMEASALPEAHRPMARRLIHALSIQRLMAGDMYSAKGVTPSELCDALCLFQPGLDDAGGDPAGALVTHVTSVLEELRRHVIGPLITIQVHDRRYHLHFKKFRRFLTPELVIHWVNAIPFLLLMLTGGLMLGSRFSHLDREVSGIAVDLHKLCALAWLCGMPLTVLARVRPHWANIRTMLTWGPGDAVWMIQSLRSLYKKSAVIPPAHRFNTGQKINACLVMLYYFGFSATGLLMYAKGSMLIPWYAHTALFFSALGSVGGHLYLALLNPSTRIALAGIFHGWAPMKYIEHHHALSLPKALHDHAKPQSVRAVTEEILRSRVELIILAVTLVLGGIGAYAFGQGRVATIKKQFAKSFADVIQPSELSTRHRIGPASESCTKCHLYTGEIPDAKCEECHANIRDRRAEKIGYHGQLKGDCRYCHREHRERSVTLVPLDRNTFDHSQALFKLEGRHAAVACDDCHKKARQKDTPGIYYIGLPHTSCTDCHRDPHAGQFAAACTDCHTPAGWTGTNLLFSHSARSDFKLEGRHAAVDCRKCHKPPSASAPLAAAVFKGQGRACLDCHEDPHRKQFADRCTACHSPAGWSRDRISFSHDRDTKFPLLEKHAQVACEKCHTPERPGDPLARAAFQGLKTACADCHQDPHRGQFARNCTVCHPTPATFSVGAPRFQHNRDTAFALTGRHEAVRCIQCHKPPEAGGALGTARFKGLDTSCASCHEVKHPESYGTACTACHTTAAWPKKQAVFDHKRDFQFDLVGKHRAAKCSACHNPAIMDVRKAAPATDFSCVTCHAKNDPHGGSLGTSCAKCHTPVGWKGEDLLFEHDSMSRFPLNRDHEKVACAKCHKDNRWKPLDTECSSCHPKFFLNGKK